MNRCTPALRLSPHPSTQPSDARALTVSVEVTKDGGLRLDFRLQASPDCLRMPLPAPAVQTDLLWQHTCFEAFVALEGESAYREFNFSPSGAWAIYGFERYRTPVEAPYRALAAPTIAVAWAAGEYRLIAQLEAPELSSFGPAQALRLGLCAVLEGADGALAYYALRHHRERPDFHDRAGFVLQLPADRLGASALWQAQDEEIA